MKRLTWVTSFVRLLKQERGSVLVEYTVVFPLLALTALGTVDVAYLMFEHAVANKATYFGARLAVVSNPVAQNITDFSTLYTATQQANINLPCFDPSSVSSYSATGNCPSAFAVSCTSTACNPTTYGFDPSAFTAIYNKMATIFPDLQASEVTVSYAVNGTGYIGRPGGLPMSVTVSINKDHTMFFMGALLTFFGGPNWFGSLLPASSTTLPSESMGDTNL